MQTLKYISHDNREVEFTNYPPYILWKVQGTELPAVDPVFTQAPSQHGYTLSQLLYDSRTIKLSCHVHGNRGLSHMYEARKRINAVCNPLRGLGTLVYQNDYSAWKIQAFCKEAAYISKIKEVQTLDITFECPSPFWESVEKRAILLAYIGGGLKFPVVTPNYFGMTGYLAVVDNTSDVNVYPTFEMEGGSINPVITNLTTGEFIKLQKDLEEHESLYIDTNPETQEVSLISVNPLTGKPARTNAYGYLTTDSTLMQLAPGENKITFESENENKRIKIVIKYSEYYIGV